MSSWKSSVAVAALLGALFTPAYAQQKIKIAWIDPMSGLMASVGTNQLKTFQFLADEFNQKNSGGPNFEVIGIDNKLSTQETASAIRSAIDQGARYIVQGTGSGPALAIIEALEKHNSRNPGDEVLYLNYAAVDPDLTNSKCSYWHFRLDADTSMKMEVLTTFMKEQADVKKIYLINQNYSHGQQVSRFAKENLKNKRPDIQIVGDDFHPLAQVRDFAPYIAKIKASGADAVITGNWGSDLALLIKASNDAGLNVKFFTFYATAPGVPTALASSPDAKVFDTSYNHYNAEGPLKPLLAKFKAKFNDDLNQSDAYTVFAMLTEAFKRARKTDPKSVAATLEGMKFKSFNGEVEVRRTDHQLQQGLYVTRWEKASARFPYSPENTGYTLAPVKYYESYVASTPTSCQMKRP